MVNAWSARLNIADRTRCKACGRRSDRLHVDLAVLHITLVSTMRASGIVADSNPDSEQAECIAKAAGVFRAADEARRFASQAQRGR